MLCYCVLPNRYNALVLQFVTARDTLIILIILYHILRHFAAFEAIFYLQVCSSHYTLFALNPSCLDTAKAKAKAVCNWSLIGFPRSANTSDDPNDAR